MIAYLDDFVVSQPVSTADDPEHLPVLLHGIINLLEWNSLSPGPSKSSGHFFIPSRSAFPDYPCALRSTHLPRIGPTTHTGVSLSSRLLVVSYCRLSPNYGVCHSKCESSGHCLLYLILFLSSFPKALSAS